MLSASEQSNRTIENFSNDELNSLKFVGFQLLFNLNCGFIEWIIDDFHFKYDETHTSLRFLLKNHIKCPFCFNFQIKEPLLIEKLNFNYQWVVYNYFLSKWLEENDILHEFSQFKVENAVQKIHFIIISKKFENEMTISDLEFLENFVEKLFYITNFLYQIQRKTIGYSWVFIDKLEKFSRKNYLILNKLKQYLKEKSNFRRELALLSKDFQRNNIENNPLKTTRKKSSHISLRFTEENSEFSLTRKKNSKEKPFSNENLLEAPPLFNIRVPSMEITEKTKGKRFIEEKNVSISHNQIEEKTKGAKRKSSLFKFENIEKNFQKNLEKNKNIEFFGKYARNHSNHSEINFEKNAKKIQEGPVLSKKLYTEEFGGNDQKPAEKLCRFNRAITLSSKLASQQGPTINKNEFHENKKETEVSKETSSEISSNFNEQKTLHWKTEYLNGVKNTSIFMNLKPIKQTFPISHLLLQLLIKYEAIFFLMEVRIQTSETNNVIFQNYDDLKQILKKTKIFVTINQQKALKNPWKDCFFFDFFEFFSIFFFEKEPELISKKEFIMDFLNKKNFKKSDQIKLIFTLRKKIKFENLKIVFQEKKISKEIQESFLKKPEILIVSEPEAMKISLSHHDSSEIVLCNEDIHKLEFYNTVKFLSKTKYYFKYHEKHLFTYMRVHFLNENSVFISFYSPFDKKNEYCKLTQTKEIVKKFLKIYSYIIKQKNKGKNHQSSASRFTELFEKIHFFLLYQNKTAKWKKKNFLRSHEYLTILPKNINFSQDFFLFIE